MRSSISLFILSSGLPVQPGENRKRALPFFAGVLLSLALLAGFFVTPSLRAEEPETSIPRYNEALTLYRQKKYDASLEVLRSIFAEYKNSYELRMLASANYIRLQGYDSAMAHLQHCIEEHPDRWEPRLMMAGLLRSLRRYYPAIQQARVGLSRDPENRGLLLELARSLYKVGRYGEVRKSIEPLLKKNPDDPEALALEGLVFLRMKQYDLAEFRFRQALKHSPEEEKPDLNNNLGFVVEKRGDQFYYQGNRIEAASLYKEASQLYATVLQKEPEHVEARLNQARIRKKGG